MPDDLSRSLDFYDCAIVPGGAADADAWEAACRGAGMRPLRTGPEALERAAPGEGALLSEGRAFASVILAGGGIGSVEALDALLNLILMGGSVAASGRVPDPGSLRGAAGRGERAVAAALGRLERYVSRAEPGDEINALLLRAALPALASARPRVRCEGVSEERVRLLPGAPGQRAWEIALSCARTGAQGLLRLPAPAARIEVLRAGGARDAGSAAGPLVEFRAGGPGEALLRIREAPLPRVFPVGDGWLLQLRGAPPKPLADASGWEESCSREDALGPGGARSYGIALSLAEVPELLDGESLRLDASASRGIVRAFAGGTELTGDGVNRGIFTVPPALLSGDGALVVCAGPAGDGDASWGLLREPLWQAVRAGDCLGFSL